MHGIANTGQICQNRNLGTALVREMDSGRTDNDTVENAL
jgi:hypothetical protein